jgi:tRNA (cytidine/uridine-2'-O-)-methyltransferase
MTGEAAHNAPERHVVLVAPEVHWNTGNIGRTCLGAGAALHLIEPVGFSLDHKHVRRAGLDYWHRVDLTVWPDVDAFLTGMAPRPDEVALFSKRGEKSLWTLRPSPRQFLIFGSETRGLPPSLPARYPGAVYHIPITGDIRSLNLSTAVGIALYESLRRGPFSHAWIDD